MIPINMISLEHYAYALPEGLIANAPASPRDSARLFVYDTRTDVITFDTFRNIGAYLPAPSLLVFNNTKVIPARLWLSKETGGKIEVLLMMNEYRRGDVYIKGVVDRKILPGAKLFFKNGEYLDVVRQEEQFFFFKPSVSIEVLRALLQKEGVTPIPPYIRNNALSERTLRAKYQSVLAKHPASVAAPTASLHFTKPLLTRLAKHGISKAEVTLHVGAGTFAPITEKNIAEKRLFTEYYEITKKSAATIGGAKRNNVPVIPVGTTALRTLESAAGKAGAAATNIFIYPPYEFMVADALITNFHVPRSSLMLLVDAFLLHKNAGRRILELYDIAIREKFRFYSFGDGMLII